MLFVYGYEYGDDLLYIGKTNSLMERFIEHCQTGNGIISDYLRHLIFNHQYPKLIIFGYWDEKIASYYEKKLIRDHSTCKYLLNKYLREDDYRISTFIKQIDKLTEKDPMHGLKIPSFIKQNLLEIEKNYFSRYATIETN